MKVEKIIYVLKAVIAFSLLQFFMVHANAQEQVTCSNAGVTSTCRITEPNVKQRITNYPQITFKAGDSVTVSAGGCVQTGGSGATWKLYVNPSGSNSDRLYHGLIQIPGVDSDLVRIAGVINRTIAIPSTIPANASLNLGYEDDGYSDNGYWGHDDGTENQCRNVGNAFVVITIKHGGVVVGGGGSAAPFDLVFTATDPNDFPLNPEWAWQRDHNALPDADTQCFALSNNFSNPACTTQSPSIDNPSGWNAAWCAVGAQHSINGHVNWMPGTWQGPITWDGHSSPGTDDDYNINLVPQNSQGLTVSSQGSIHSEFDSDETIDHFHTPWWNSFHSAVDNGDASARAMIDNKTAIVMGLVGLDCEHGCATEMHPVYALAIHVNSDPQDDTWAIFARNWGDEGYCSQYQHPLDTNRIAFLIPHDAATGVKLNVASTFLTNNSQVSGPGVSLVPGQGAIVEFTLPSPDAGARVDGELHLQWTANASSVNVNRAVTAGNVANLHIAATAVHPVAQQVNPESEKRLAGVLGQLPADKQTVLKGKLTTTPAYDGLKPGPLSSTSAKPARAATTRAVAAPAKAQKDLDRAKAICAAYNRSIPNMPNVCANVPAN
ncbi:MAG TPA: hypothetical protein VHW70_06515 [Edaphobacter sp.]|jgi:hypothetical protein|nr:hypothetical protein [Edaphobacter sp.]